MRNYRAKGLTVGKRIANCQAQYPEFASAIVLIDMACSVQYYWVLAIFEYANVAQCRSEPLGDPMERDACGTKCKFLTSHRWVPIKAQGTYFALKRVGGQNTYLKWAMHSELKISYSDSRLGGILLHWRIGKRDKCQTQRPLD